MSSWCPPLFDEAPQRYTKRLFLYASDEIAELLRQKYKIRGYVTPDYEYMAHMAWLIGATSAAQALIREIDLVKSAWGRGDEQKTLIVDQGVRPTHDLSLARRHRSATGADRRCQESSV